MSQYRLPFYDQLRRRLDELGIDLVVVHGDPEGAEARKGDTVDLPWGRKVHNRVVGLGPAQLVWQPARDLVGDVDLVVVEQASKHLLNYLLLAAQARGRIKVALWGHGRSFKEGTASPLGEAIKRVVTRRAHWCFAYNELAATAFRDAGFPAERITVVQNAIDTRQLQDLRGDLSAEELAEKRRHAGLSGDHVGLYCGVIYPVKRPEFLVAAARHVRAAVEDFELLVVGAGASSDVVLRAAGAHPWIHCVGPKFGRDKVAYFALSKVFLLPGWVGLAILDSFALEVPLVASASVPHSPEIAYLRDGENGLLVDDGGDPARYAAAVVRVLTDESLRERLRAGCRTAREVYTVEDMAERFAQGIVRALANASPEAEPSPSAPNSRS
jgi:glycosyltransferase involved in cell wall biosynthesis